MNSGAFHSSIRKAYDFCLRNGLVRQVATLGSFKPTDEFRELCFSPEISYLALFLAGLSSSQFNFVLEDYSYFQFSRLGEADLRYAFYPSPFSGARIGDVQVFEEMLQEGLISFEEFSDEVGDLEPEVRRPIVRYEYCEAQYKPFVHPASHIHFGQHADNRLAVERLFTPHAFTLFITKLFFADQWMKQATDFLDDGTAIGAFDKLLIGEKAGSAVLPSALFSAHERRLLFLA